MSILVIYTGGTIGMVENEDGTLVPGNGENLKQIINEEANREVSFLSLSKPMDSSDIGVEEINSISSAIEDNYTNYEAFLILTGTDTMAYLSSILSYVLEGLTKPIVLTGSQYPVGTKDNDGEGNLRGAIRLLLNEKAPNRVSIYFHKQILTGNSAIKFSSYKVDGFKSFNASEEISKEGVFSVQKLKAKNILVIVLNPYVQTRDFKEIIDNETYDAIVLNTYGAGNMKAELVNCLLNTKNNRTKFIIRSQCIEGGTELGKYKSSVINTKFNILDARDLTLETSLAKVVYLLNKNLDIEEFKSVY